tara:strand:+ start:17237 stop:17728 length:492 start_codon:yes stop_codon:yes gene_type:complete
MSNIQWVYGMEPQSMPDDWRQRIIELFLRETGEVYADVSLASLNIPKWEGNLLLIDNETYPEAESLKGLLWSLPFLEDGVRVAAFVVEQQYQSHGHGSDAWDHLIEHAQSLGKKTIQLEVKADNTRAQDFYQKRGLAIVEKLEHYYQSGLGYMMRGDIEQHLA